MDNINIKNWDFPSFEDWDKDDREYRATIGSYNCHIRMFSWSTIKDEITYKAAISISDNPLNVHSETIVRYFVGVSSTETDKLKQWYEDICKEMNLKWEEYILEEYIDQGE